MKLLAFLLMLVLGLALADPIDRDRWRRINQGRIQVARRSEISRSVSSPGGSVSISSRTVTSV